MVWEKFKDQFHPSWWNKIKPFIESKECDKIYEYLKFESKRGKRIAPSSFHTYRAFLETPLNEIKVVLLGYCPYHSFINGSPVADGIMFSCSITNKLQPSLTAFYRGLENDLYNGLNLSYDQDPDLSYLCKEGVFLWNSALTVEAMKAGSHQELWHDFTKYILENVFIYTGIPIVFIGKDAQFYERYVTPLTHGPIFRIEHPSFAQRESRDWETKGVFSKINRIVKENNGYTINWFNEQKEDELPF